MIKKIFSMLCLMLVIGLPAWANKNNLNRHKLYQVSTIQALLEGLYQGSTTAGELHQHGDFGLGTLNDLDGEMIGLDGRFYQATSNGRVHLVQNRQKIPYAMVHFFQPNQTFSWKDSITNQEMESLLTEHLETLNMPYAIRIRGAFDFMTVRSLSKQRAPYPHLTDAVRHQSIFELKNVKGTLVGYRCPDYMTGLVVPGYHFHFLAQDHKIGGHVIAYRAKMLRVELEPLPSFEMDLVDSDAFRHLNLTQPSKIQDAIQQVEHPTDP